ncbi:MAG: hypothetical protein H6672_22870 [Anaerolineaceae bacterium]|nr:hypothetical protein [Anaerolineaceae bacterium]
MDIIRQKGWSEQELIAQGFRYYHSRKQVSMIRRLPVEEAPMHIQTEWDTLVVHAGYYIAYRAGDTLHPRLEDYHPRPINPEIFQKTYAPWDEPYSTLTPTERHLYSLGCRPYYKKVGVWAKRITHEIMVQSIESSEPAVVPPGAWVCVGIRGEPWSTTDDWIRARYHVPESAFLATFTR